MEQPSSNFYADKRSKDGLASNCKSCACESARKYKEKKESGSYQTLQNRPITKYLLFNEEFKDDPETDGYIEVTRDDMPTENIVEGRKWLFTGRDNEKICHLFRFDPDDSLFHEYTWGARKSKDKRTWYVSGSKKGTAKRVLYHKKKTGFKQTDHRNNNGLDNRSCNLEETTDLQNGLGRRISCNSTTGIAGVKYYKWKGEIRGYTAHYYEEKQIAKTFYVKHYLNKRECLFCKRGFASSSSKYRHEKGRCSVKKQLEQSHIDQIIENNFQSAMGECLKDAIKFREENHNRIIIERQFRM